MKPYAIISKATFGLTLAILAVQGTFAHAAEIRVLSSNGVHSVMVEMVPAFERATGHKISIDYNTANQVVDRIKGGESADLVIITRPTADGLIKQGKIVAGTDPTSVRPKHSNARCSTRSRSPSPRPGGAGSISPKWPSALVSQTRSTPRPRYQRAARSALWLPAGKPRWRSSRSPNSWRCPASSTWDRCPRSCRLRLSSPPV
jgi:hypothetical protein